ncbi:MAG: MMPL family transporter [Planctomycetia bacterium]|nr:MMPL family transporter [Planctomycetia bacterium]
MKIGFFKEYALPILAVVIFLLSFIWMGTRATIQSNSNSVEDWLPENHQETQDYKWFLNHFPFESFVVVSWNDCTLDNADKIEFFAQKLVPGQTIDNFSLMTPVPDIAADLNLENVQDRIPKEDIHKQRQKDHVSVSDGDNENSNFSGSDTTTSRVADLPDSALFKSVMTGPRLLRLLEQSYARMPSSGQTAEETRADLIDRLKGTLVGPDGHGTAMIITLQKGKRNGKELKKILDRIRELSIECGLPNTIDIQTGSFASKVGKALYDFYRESLYGRQPNLNGIIMGGPPTDNVALDQEGERTLYRLAGICAMIGLTVAFLCLRSIRLTLFVFWVAIISAGIAMAMVAFTGGTCDSILLSMPALVYVIAMSGSIHLVNYYHDAILEGGLQGATERAVHHAFTPSFFAQFTTAIGLGSLYASHLVPIVKFGFYSAIGVLITLILLFLYLPALLYFYPSRKFAEQHAHKGLDGEENKFTNLWKYIGGFVINHNIIVSIVCLGIMIFLGLQLPNIKTSVKMMNFFSDDADIIANYTWLEEKLGPLVPMELVVSFDNNKLRPNVFGTSERLRLVNRISDALKKKLHEDVGGTLSVGLFAPDIDSVANPDSFYFNMVSTVVGKTVNNSRKDLKDYLTVEGNPSLDEVLLFLKEKGDAAKAVFEKNQKDLSAKIREKGGDPDLLFAEAQKSTDVKTKNLGRTQAANSSFAKEIQNCLQLKNDWKELESMRETLASEKESLIASGIKNLKDLLEVVPKDRAFRNLSLEKTMQLTECMEVWQRDKGIDLWRISIRVWALKKDIDYSRFIDDVKQVTEPILAEASAKLEEILVRSGNTDPQAKKKAEDKKFQDQTALASGLSVSADENQNSMGPGHKSDIIYPVGISAKYTGMVPLVYKTQHELINGLAQSLMWAFVLIALVILFLYRNFTLSMIAMFPNIFPVVVVFGYMGWRGILVDVGTMMTASVALGVAVDDTIHYLTWYTDGLDRGLSINDAARAAYRRCATAMLQSSLISGLGLFAFAFSTFVPTQRFGVLMLAILFVAEFGDLIFLPSLLTGPLGRYYVKRRQGSRKRNTGLKADSTQPEIAKAE